MGSLHVQDRAVSVRNDRGWKRRFDDPIPLPHGRQLFTLKDAADYITKLPKAEHEAPEWQAAMEALILVATHGGPTMFARIGIIVRICCRAQIPFDGRTVVACLLDWANAVLKNKIFTGEKHARSRRKARHPGPAEPKGWNDLV